MTDVRDSTGPAENGPSAAPPGTPVQVTVIAEGRPGAVIFTHEWRFQGGHHMGKGGIEIPKRFDTDPGTPIHFHLSNRTQPRVQLQFVNSDDAIWVNRRGCPESEPSFDREITCIEPSGERLSVLDRNQEDCTLYYNLRFEPDPNTYYYDPEIRNGGVKT